MENRREGRTTVILGARAITGDKLMKTTESRRISRGQPTRKRLWMRKARLEKDPFPFRPLLY